MFSLDDETCIDEGLCGDYLPQYFELVDGEVRVRSTFGDESAEEASTGVAPPRHASARR